MKNKRINPPLFPNQDWGRSIYKHKKFPVYLTDEFDFFRCVEFNETLYKKNVCELNAGNLRLANTNNRYSSLFPNQMLSYWADSVKTARKEIKRHGASNNIITFWAYDDATSTFPIINNNEPLIIIDGRDVKFHKILEKTEEGKPLTQREIETIKEINDLNPDCLAYWSVANPGGVNFLFFEKGFKKLSIREVRLRMGDLPGKNYNVIVCAVSCDYNPYPNTYSNFFLPLAKKGEDIGYYETEDYKEKCRIKEKSYIDFKKRFKWDLF